MEIITVTFFHLKFYFKAAPVVHNYVKARKNKSLRGETLLPQKITKQKQKKVPLEIGNLKETTGHMWERDLLIPSMKWYKFSSQQQMNIYGI